MSLLDELLQSPEDEAKEKEDTENKPDNYFGYGTDFMKAIGSETKE